VSLQYAVPRSRLSALIARLKSDDVLSVCAGRVLELKLVGGPGKAMLGLNADGPVVCANVLWTLRLPDEAESLYALERALREVGGRPHLGKLHELDGTGDTWPQREQFAAIVARADPKGRLGGEAALRRATFKG